MDNEMKDMLNLILGKLSRLEEGQKKLEKGQAKLEEGQAKQDSLEHRVAHIEGTINAVGEVLRQERA